MRKDSPYYLPSINVLQSATLFCGVDEEAGMEFLGSQGDVWDTQKDMLADTLGAIFSLILFLTVRPDSTKEER